MKQPLVSGEGFRLKQKKRLVSGEVPFEVEAQRLGGGVPFGKIECFGYIWE